MPTFERGTREANAQPAGKPLAPGQGAAKTGEARDVMDEAWAVRNHPHRLHLRSYEGPGRDGPLHQNVRMARGTVVNPEKSLCAGGTVVRGRSRKGKFAGKNFRTMMGKSDARLTPAPMRYAQPDPVLVAPPHVGTPLKTARHIPLRCR